MSARDSERHAIPAEWQQLVFAHVKRCTCQVSETSIRSVASTSKVVAEIVERFDRVLPLLYGGKEAPQELMRLAYTAFAMTPSAQSTPQDAETKSDQKATKMPAGTKWVLVPNKSIWGKTSRRDIGGYTWIFDAETSDLLSRLRDQKDQGNKDIDLSKYDIEPRLRDMTVALMKACMYVCSIHETIHHAVTEHIASAKTRGSRLATAVSLLERLQPIRQVFFASLSLLTSVTRSCQTHFGS